MELSLPLISVTLGLGGQKYDRKVHSSEQFGQREELIFIITGCSWCLDKVKG